MNRPEYWQWVERIWALPHDITIRLVFADWLDEQGCGNAARKQRVYAKQINKAYVIFSCVCAQYGGNRSQPRESKKVYGYTSHKNDKWISTFEIKHDGRVVIANTTQHLYNGIRKHVLCGSFYGKGPYPISLYQPKPSTETPEEAKARIEEKDRTSLHCMVTVLAYGAIKCSAVQS